MSIKRILTNVTSFGMLFVWALGNTACCNSHSGETSGTAKRASAQNTVGTQ